MTQGTANSSHTYPCGCTEYYSYVTGNVSFDLICKEHLPLAGDLPEQIIDALSDAEDDE